MPVETVPGTAITYHLIAFDAEGNERAEGGRLLSDEVRQTLADGDYTDVFIFSHGWMGDMPYARLQYNNWLKAMAACEADMARMEGRRGFKPFLLALHWPSRPWGNETLDSAPASFSIDPAGSPVEKEFIAEYATSIADTPRAREALTTMYQVAASAESPELPAELRQAYEVLHEEANLTATQGPGGPPGEDNPEFNVDAIVEESREMEEEDAEWDDSDTEPVSFGMSFLPSALSFDVLLSPLRVLSFWKMKERSRRFGESGAHRLLAGLQRAGAGRGLRFHLMGHSFGCGVVSGMLAGPAGDNQLEAPVDSLVLMQGAISLWSYCADITPAPGQAGYFHGIMKQGRVAGPIVTTQSRHDKAVGRFYPLGARLANHVAFGTLSPVSFNVSYPLYGGVGAYGLQGAGLETTDDEMRDAEAEYAFEPGHIYNLEGSRYIATKEAFTGAHSDIAHPEVAHIVWQAALPRS